MSQKSEWTPASTWLGTQLAQDLEFFLADVLGKANAAGFGPAQVAEAALAIGAEVTAHHIRLAGAARTYWRTYALMQKSQPAPAVPKPAAPKPAALVSAKPPSPQPPTAAAHKWKPDTNIATSFAQESERRRAIEQAQAKTRAASAEPARCESAAEIFARRRGEHRH